MVLLAVPLAVVLTGCATQPPFERPAVPLPDAWTIDVATSASTPVPPQWWRELNDPAINALVEATLNDNPTIAQAVANLDEARAQSGIEAARKLPNIGASAGGDRAKGLNVAGASGNLVSTATTASWGPAISWELDVFGRVRQSAAAAKSRLDARTADAEAVRLSTAAEVVSDVLSLRACRHSRDVLADDIRSRSVDLALTRQRVAAGASAPVDEARSRSGLASARADLVARDEECTRMVNALVALRAADVGTLRTLFRAEQPASEVGERTQALALTPLPVDQVPKAVLELPAQVLLRHPSVRAAENDAAAAWADIGVARAERLPRIDLAAALSGEWIRSAGTTLRYVAWSLGPAVNGTLFDGGAGAANVDAAAARYRGAVAALRLAVLAATEDVENALAARQSADARATLTKESADAARTTFIATEDQWRVGAVSLFELDDARRQLAAALDSAVAADRDRGQAWVALVKATGNTLSNPVDTTP